MQERLASDAEVPKVSKITLLLQQSFCRLAYDGRGNVVVRELDHLEAAVSALGGLESQLYVEEWVAFKKELAVMVARSETDVD